MTYRSLIGGYFSNTTDRTLPVSIRFNNPGAINGASWERTYPGYVAELETTPGNRTTIFETPEQGVAVWWELMRKYRDSGARTVGAIITRYGGGQDYSAYADFVVRKTGFGASRAMPLDDDETLLPFAKAMFWYEAGKATPLSDEQILYGFKLGRAGGTLTAPSVPTPVPVAKLSFWTWLLSLFAPVKPVPPPQRPPVSLPRVPPSTTGGIPPWLTTMKQITGTDEYPGGEDNPVIMSWVKFIGDTFPDMRSYCANYTHDEIPWCGLTVAYAMARNGIRPVFGPTETDKFLWADAWKNFGRRLDKPVLGCVMVFTRNGGGHVSLYEGEDDDSYIIRGGNQSDSVNVIHMSKSKLTAAVWPV